MLGARPVHCSSWQGRAQEEQCTGQQSHHPLLPREQAQPTTGLPASSFPTDMPSPLSTQDHVPREKINPPTLLPSILPRLPVVRPRNRCSHPPLTSPQVWSHFLLQTHPASSLPFPAPTLACCQHHTLTRSLSQKACAHPVTFLFYSPSLSSTGFWGEPAILRTPEPTRSHPGLSPPCLPHRLTMWTVIVCIV